MFPVMKKAALELEARIAISNAGMCNKEACHSKLQIFSVSPAEPRQPRDPQGLWTACPWLHEGRRRRC